MSSGAFAASRLVHDLLSELPGRSRNHLSFSRHSPRETRLEKVARSIAPEAAPLAIDTEQLRSRLGSDCYLHTMSDADRPEFHCFVEKRSRNGREYRFNRAKSDKPCDASSRLLPRLIATHRDRFGFTTYVQYVPLRLAAFLEDHGAEHLADVVFRIAEIEPVAAVHKMQPKNRFTPATLDALLNCAENGGAMANDRARASIETVRSLWDRAASVVPAGPLVLAHGDLHLDNLRTLGEPNGKRTLKILDWEKVGMNYVGADLDFVARGHLARAGLSATPFLDRYFARAKEAFGISPPSLQLAAHLTASANCIKRTLDSGRFDNLNTAARLLVRAQRYMAVIGACLLSLPSAAGFPAGS